MSDLIRNVENFVNWLMPNRKGKMFLKTTHHCTSFTGWRGVGAYLAPRVRQRLAPVLLG